MNIKMKHILPTEVCAMYVQVGPADLQFWTVDGYHEYWFSLVQSVVYPLAQNVCIYH